MVLKHPPEQRVSSSLYPGPGCRPAPMTIADAVDLPNHVSLCRILRAFHVPRASMDSGLRAHFSSPRFYFVRLAVNWQTTSLCPSLRALARRRPRRRPRRQPRHQPPGRRSRRRPRRPPHLRRTLRPSHADPPSLAQQRAAATREGDAIEGRRCMSVPQFRSRYLQTCVSNCSRVAWGWCPHPTTPPLCTGQLRQPGTRRRICPVGTKPDSCLAQQLRFWLRHVRIPTRYLHVLLLCITFRARPLASPPPPPDCFCLKSPGSAHAFAEFAAPASIATTPSTALIFCTFFLRLFSLCFGGSWLRVFSGDGTWGDWGSEIAGCDDCVR